MSDPDALHDPFNRSRLPDDFGREHRVRMLAEVARALLEGRQPPRPAALLVGGALASWLEQGGDLVRDFLRVGAPNGSHHTAAHLWRLMRASSEGATSAEEPETIDGDDDSEGSA